MRFFVGTLVLASELEIEVNPWFICQITWVSKNGALPGTYFISYKPGSRLIRDETSTRIVRWWTLLYSVSLVSVLDPNRGYHSSLNYEISKCFVCHGVIRDF